MWAGQCLLRSAISLSKNNCQPHFLVGIIFQQNKSCPYLCTRVCTHFQSIKKFRKMKRWRWVCPWIYLSGGNAEHSFVHSSSSVPLSNCSLDVGNHPSNNNLSNSNDISDFDCHILGFNYFQYLCYNVYEKIRDASANINKHERQ